MARYVSVDNSKESLPGTFFTLDFSEDREIQLRSSFEVDPPRSFFVLDQQSNRRVGVRTNNLFIPYSYMTQQEAQCAAEWFNAHRKNARSLA